MIMEICCFIIVAIELYEILKYYKKEHLLLYEIIGLIIVALLFMTTYDLFKILLVLLLSYMVQRINHMDDDENDSYDDTMITDNTEYNNSNTEYTHKIEFGQPQDNTNTQEEITVPDTSTENISKDNKIDINNAGFEELALLPHITKIKAKKIIVYRENGNYIKSYDDLKDKLLLKDYQIEQIKQMSVIENVSNDNSRKIDF